MATSESTFTRIAKINAAMSELQRLRKKFRDTDAYQFILDMLTEASADMDGHWKIIKSNDGKVKYMCCNCGKTVAVATRACSSCGTLMVHDSGTIDKRE